MQTKRARMRRVHRVAAACGLLAVAACATGQARAGPGTAPPQSTAGAAQPSATPVVTSVTPSPSPSPTHRRRSLAGDVVVIDPGHNGGNAAHPEIINQLVNVITERKACDTAGTETDAGYPEHAFSFDVATRLAALLRKKGAKVVLTRSTDTGVGPCVTQRAAIGNRVHADVAISIHADGGPPGGSGFEVIEPGLVPGYTDKIVAPSRRLGLDVRDAYHSIAGEPYSDYIGVRGLDVRTDLGGLNLSRVPKVFIECANMRNSRDAALLTSPAFRERAARALAAGITAFLQGH
ncbi:MAG: N-acetylmuramoyl-L-alanine amidase [Micromonosporaceae bacterium]